MVSAHPWLQGVVSEKSRAALLRAGVERRYETDEVLYVAGTPATSLQLVLEGRVRLMRGSHDRAVMIHDEQTGGSLGEVPLFEGTTYPATAIASEPTRCLVLSRDAVLAAVRDNPDLALALLARLAGRVRLLVDRLDQQTGQSTLGRLAHHVLVRATTSRGATFTLGGTQQQIAEEIGAVRELVVRGLRTLRARNAIESRGGGRYAIADTSLLRAIAATGA
jgi:CRP/FNR family transcriptional regulator, dissimilatory nitrate respiration regulator